MGKGKPEGRHWVDGEWMTTREVAARVGVSVSALLIQKHNQGVSVPALVRMYDSGLIDAGRSRGQKYMVRGRWTTIGEEAARLGVTWRAINKWMHNHGQGGAKGHAFRGRAPLRGRARRARKAIQGRPGEKPLGEREDDDHRRGRRALPRRCARVPGVSVLSRLFRPDRRAVL